MTVASRPVRPRESTVGFDGLRQPNFIYVGMPKAGSTWLYEVLRANPSVYVPDSKGIDFFDRHYARGVDWYLGHFEAAGRAKAVGELSHDTYANPEAARRIHALFPDMRVIFCLREPGDAARSILQWWSTHTRAFGDTVASMTAHPHYRSLLAYRENLERYFDVFDRSRVLVLFYEDLGRDPAQFLATVHEFLGLDPAELPPATERRFNVSRTPRNAAFARAVYRAGGLFRWLGAGRLVERAKTLGLVQSVLYGANPSTLVSGEIRAAMAEARQRVRPDFPRIAELSGRSLPREWLEAGPA